MAQTKAQKALAKYPEASVALDGLPEVVRVPFDPSKMNGRGIHIIDAKTGAEYHCRASKGVVGFGATEIELTPWGEPDGNVWTLSLAGMQDVTFYVLRRVEYRLVSA